MRQPPDKRRAGAVLRLFAEAEARQDDGSPRRGRMGVDIGQPDLDFRNAVRVGGGFGLRQQGFPLLVAGQHRIEQAFGPPGASCATVPMRAFFGTLAEPASEMRSPRISFKSVDLPVPLRPTRPTLWPSGREAEAPSSRSLPPIRKVRLLICNMERRSSGRMRTGEPTLSH